MSAPYDDPSNPASRLEERFSREIWGEEFDVASQYRHVATHQVPRDCFFDELLPGPDAYCVPVDGICMKPQIFDGDLVIASPSAKPKVGRPVVLYLRNGTASVKILKLPPLENVWTVDGRHFVEVATLNPPHKFTITTDRLLAIHAVIGVLPGNREEPK